MKTENLSEQSIQCARCGTCCRKGGAAFHDSDFFLIENGIIPLSHLYTIRQGEPVYDNVANRMETAQTDIIKIKNIPDSTVCIYFIPDNNSCKIYENRPDECRLLKCWDTRDIIERYAEGRLTRERLIGSVEGLWEIVQDHQRQCPMELVGTFVEEMKSSGKKIAQLEKKIAYMVQYDLSIRALISEKEMFDVQMLDFLLGRSITRLLGSWGLREIRQGNKLIFRLS